MRRLADLAQALLSIRGAPSGIGAAIGFAEEILHSAAPDLFFTILRGTEVFE